MITAEIRINCGLIGHIYCVNEEGRDDGWCTYRYEYYTIDEGAEKRIIKGKVQHYRPNGAVALLKEICEDIESQGGS